MESEELTEWLILSRCEICKDAFPPPPKSSSLYASYPYSDSGTLMGEPCAACAGSSLREGAGLYRPLSPRPAKSDFLHRGLL